MEVMRGVKKVNLNLIANTKTGSNFSSPRDCGLKIHVTTGKKKACQITCELSCDKQVSVNCAAMLHPKMQQSVAQQQLET